jgi:hypothetical protein
MPFHEMTLAVFAAPTRPMPQPIEPSRPGFRAAQHQRPINRLIRLNIGRFGSTPKSA